MPSRPAHRDRPLPCVVPISAVKKIFANILEFIDPENRSLLPNSGAMNAEEAAPSALGVAGCSW